MLSEYDKKIHEEQFPPAEKSTVEIMAADGNEKVLVRVCNENAPSKRRGRPNQKKKKKRPYNNGWFMITDPETGRVLAVEPM